VRTRLTRTAAMAAAAALVLAACGDDADDQQAAPEGENDQSPEDLDEDALDDMMGDQEDVDDPNEDIEDGIYRGNGVILPVPDGWSLDPMAAQQGTIAAVSEEGTQQLVAQAIDVAQMEEMGQSMDLDTILEQQRDGIQEELGIEPTVDEEVELEGAERAHRLTYTDIPGQQEDMPDSTATLILAEDGDGLLAEFSFSAATEDYDEDVEALLLAEAGFDPDSEPAEPMMPEQQPAPEGGGEGGEISPEDLEEMEEMFEDEG
jgi:hypothetical protein